MTERNQQNMSGVHEGVTADNSREQLSTEKDAVREEHSFGLHWGEQREREHRGEVISTIVLAVLFVALLGTYAYLHGSTRFELFQPTPTSSTMQQQQSSSQTISPKSSESSSSLSSNELTTEPSPGDESGSTSETTRQPLFPPFGDSGSTQPSDSRPVPESSPAQ